MFDLLGPGEVGDVDQTVNTLFQLNKDTEVGEVADRSGVFGTDRVFGHDVCPRIRDELLDAERHLAVLAVEGEHNSFHFVADFEEVVRGAQVL